MWSTTKGQYTVPFSTWVHVLLPRRHHLWSEQIILWCHDTCLILWESDLRIQTWVLKSHMIDTNTDAYGNSSVELKVEGMDKKVKSEFLSDRIPNGNSQKIHLTVLVTWGKYLFILASSIKDLKQLECWLLMSLNKPYTVGMKQLSNTQAST